MLTILKGCIGRGIVQNLIMVEKPRRLISGIKTPADMRPMVTNTVVRHGVERIHFIYVAEPKTMKPLSRNH